MTLSIKHHKIAYICCYCGSDDVFCDAYASWNVEKQAWEVAGTFDKGAFCNKCGGDSRLEELERETMTETTHRCALERADRIIGWMMSYIGRMAPPSNGIYDLNEHGLYMEALRRKEGRKPQRAP